MIEGKYIYTKKNIGENGTDIENKGNLNSQHPIYIVLFRFKQLFLFPLKWILNGIINSRKI